MTHSSTSKWTHVWVFFLFAGVTLAFTYPLIAQMGTHFAGDNVDVWLNMWANWWTRKVLHEGLPFYDTTDIFYPHGAPLYFHSFSHTNTALWLPLEPWLGPLAAYNVTVLVGFTLLAFGIYLVVYELTGHAGAGFVAGLAATFAPYHVWECVHPNLFSTQYIPLLLWALITVVRRPTWWRGILAGGFFALNVLTGWHQPMYAAVIVAPYLLWSLAVQRESGAGFLACRRWNKDLWRALLIAALVAAVLAGTVALPLLREQMRAGYAGADIDWIFDTDLLALIIPSLFHPLWGNAVRPFYERFPSPNRPVYVGYVVLVLALVGLVHCVQRKHWRERGWLVVATPLSLVLALGTKLYVNGEVLLPDLPWYGPIIGFIRAPIRLNLMLSQCLAMLAGFAVAHWLRKQIGWRGSVAAAALSVLVLFDFLAWPFPTTLARVSPFYVQLAQDPGTFAIVEAPLDRQTDKFYMYWQTVHEKSLVNGHISRPPASAFNFINENPITYAFANRLPLQGQTQLSAALAALAEANVRYIVIHREFLPPELATDWSAALATRPLYEDEYLTVFSTQPEPGVHFGVEHDFAGLVLSQAWLEPGQPPVLESHWSAPARRDVTVTLRTVTGQVLSTQTLTVEAGTFSIVQAPLPLPDLPPGEYELLFSSGGESFVLPQRLVATPVGQAFQPAGAGWFTARFQPDTVWNASIALRGINWHRLANTLYVDLQWEARRTPGADYKYFVHLLDENDALVAQFDGMPCHWTYPTSLWKAGESVADQAPVDLRSVPAGTYRLAIGWYVPDTGQQLDGVDAAGQSLPKDRLLLDQAVVIP
jgi:hypothetical protein